MSNRVALIKETSYDFATLSESIGRAVSLSGFDLAATRGKRVLLKPNMLGAYRPEMGITTHPSFVKEVARIFIDAGAIVSIGDSPNGVYPIDQVWDETGIREVCRETGARELQFEGAGSCERRGIKISRAVFDTDFLINLPKFKTHGLTIMTLAAKNLFGCVCGMQKTRHHRECRTREKFADLIVQIADIVRPALTIMDGIVAMEGNGPSGGDLTHLGVIAAGRDVHSVDAECCRLIGLPPKNLDTLAAASARGLWDENCAIDLVGDPIDELKPAHYLLPSTYTKGMRDWWISRFLIGRIWNAMSAQPVIDAEICEKCALCVKGCPVAAIDQKDPSRAPKIDDKECVQCFCCHEICPHFAIYLKESWLLRFARWAGSRRSMNKGCHPERSEGSR